MIKKTKQQKDKYSYICPHCKERQDSIDEWQNGDILYNYDIKKQEWKDIEILNGENTVYQCPECKKDLDYELIKKYI